MTNEEIAKRADAFLNKDDKEVDDYLDTVFAGLKLTTKQAGTILGLIKAAYIVGAKENAPKWHKVADGEPVPKKLLLIYTTKGYLGAIVGAKITADSLFDSEYVGQWVAWYKGTELYYKDKDVVAWCEIPEYNGGEE